MESFRFIIAGAGFAGAATAYHLAKRGEADVLLLEQEAGPGVHASGRNAAMIRQVVPDPAIAKLARRSARCMQDVDSDLAPHISIAQNGSILLAHGEAWERLQQDAAQAQADGLSVECWTPDQILERVPVLSGARLDGGVWNPTDGIIELAPFLQGYLKEARKAGVSVRYEHPITKVSREGEQLLVETPQGTFLTPHLVDAGGAWAGSIGTLAGGTSNTLKPFRRHLYHTTPLSWVDERWPFVWDVAADLYFRPETGGLLLSACDQSFHLPGEPITDDSVEEMLAQKVDQHFPELPDLPIRNRWACLRTLSEDGRFVIGWDKSVKGLFWVAGLGGHGMTCSYAIGELAASLLVGEKNPDADPFRTSRW